MREKGEDDVKKGDAQVIKGDNVKKLNFCQKFEFFQSTGSALFCFEF